ncbi:MAG: heparinase II/III family protein [Bacteroidales bacterium]|nr:heparinase II/III family protein [Bacteroidales bacterium]
MRRFIIILCSIVLFCAPSGAQTDFDGIEWKDIRLDCSSLTESAHPRLFLNDKEFKNLKKSAFKGGYLGEIHKMMMTTAEESLLDERQLAYEKDESGRRILKVSRDALIRIVSLSYAFRITGQKAYLKAAEWNINTVCDFPDWNPTHFLDPSEMAFGVAIGYDWLYNKMSVSTREKARKALVSFAMEEAAHGIGQHVFLRSGNWNQVCIACLSAAAIATYESNPELSLEILQRGIAGNIPAAKEIYGPDGAFPEGPGYWEYGTCYQEYFNLLLETTFGTDFGLSNIEGFSKTGWYKAFTRSSDGHVFNYGDNSDKQGPSPGLWYLAWKFDIPGILMDELQFLGTKEYRKERRLLLALISAYKLGKIKIRPTERRTFLAQGSNPIMICRTGFEPEDLYLGFKGGRADTGHTHMDAGSFVFDAYGTRWVNDYYVRNYTNMEMIWGRLGLGPEQIGYTQDSYRWYLFEHNNRQHSTLTINDKNHVVTGFAPIIDTVNVAGKLGGTVDLTAVFGKDVRKAVRSLYIRDDSWLEVIDEIAAPEDTCAHVRWTFLCPVKPQIKTDGMVLKGSTATMKLSTDAPSPEYRTWSGNPADYGTPTAFGESKMKKMFICGFEFDVPAGQEVTITTSLKKQ